jgi:hypothetical protein
VTRKAKSHRTKAGCGKWRRKFARCGNSTANAGSFWATLWPCMPRRWPPILSSYWAETEYILVLCVPIEQRRSTFLFSVFLLGRDGVYSCSLSSYWAETEYIFVLCPPIGQRRSIFWYTWRALSAYPPYSIH